MVLEGDILKNVYRYRHVGIVQNDIVLLKERKRRRFGGMCVGKVLPPLRLSHDGGRVYTIVLCLKMVSQRMKFVFHYGGSFRNDGGGTFASPENVNAATPHRDAQTWVA
ncbi:hypothetical protein PIB30_049375, partial [Stylosanthes scabra]|nr:hypothetical protein [Stylosanthes scabra]